MARRYGTGLVLTEALRDFTLRIWRGEHVAVLGPSGSGKTTFLNLAGLLEPVDAGTLSLDGQDTASLSDDARAAWRNSRIGFVFQNFGLIQDLTIAQNVALPLRYRGLSRREREERALALLARVGLAARAGQRPGELSGGQQQRAAIARALVGRPELILADEPTGNLDSQSARIVQDLLEQCHAEGATVVVATHDPALAARARRRVHVLDGFAIDPGEEDAQDPHRR